MYTNHNMQHFSHPSNQSGPYASQQFSAPPAPPSHQFAAPAGPPPYPTQQYSPNQQTPHAMQQHRASSYDLSGSYAETSEYYPGSRAMPPMERADTETSYTDEDARALFRAPPVGPRRSYSPLPLPACFPQMASGPDQPFARGYNDVLARSGIELADWLKFVDALNIGMIGSPLAFAADKVGGILSFMPSVAAQIVGGGLQVAGQVSQMKVRKTLTSRVLDTANTEYFGPRGLAVRICPRGAVEAFVAQTKFIKPGAGAAISSGLQAVALRTRIGGRLVDMFSSSTPTPGAAGSTPVERRLAAFAPNILPLSLAVPPPQMPPGNRAADIVANMQQKKTKRTQAKADMKRQQLAVSQGQAVPQLQAAPDAGLGMGGRRLGGGGRRAGGGGGGGVITGGGGGGSRLAQRRAAGGVSSGGGLRANRLEMDVRNLDRLEQKEEVLWLVLVNADQAHELEPEENPEKDAK